MDFVAQAAGFTEIEDLKLRDDTRFYLEREMREDGKTLGEMILSVRRDPSTNSAWRRDFLNSLDELGLIRHDFDEMSFRVGRLYLAIDRDKYRGKLIGELRNFQTNEEYERYENIPPEKIGLVRAAVRMALEPRWGEILLRRYGLSGGDPQTLTQLAKMYSVTSERVRTLEGKARLKLKNHDGALPELYVFGRQTLERELTQKIGRLSSLEQQYRTILDELNTLEVEIDSLTKFRDAAFVNRFQPKMLDDEPEEGAEPATPLDIRVENLGLSARCANCLKRWGIMDTVGDILSYPPGEFLHIRHLGRVSANELVAKMHELGYPEFDIPGLAKLNGYAERYADLRND